MQKKSLKKENNPIEDLRDKILLNKMKLQYLLKDKDNKKVLDDWLKTELAYTSNGIEGNTLTRKETELVISEKMTTGAKPINDYIEALNHAKAFDFIRESAQQFETINEDFILKIHKIILGGIDDANAGFYRSVRVRISGSQTILPNPLKVPDLMADFGKWLEKSELDTDFIMKAIEAHYRLVSIHPFVDGNGRTARLLINAMLLKYEIGALIIRKIDRKRYLSSLETYQTTGNSEPYYKFMLSALNKSLKMMIDILDTSKPEITEELLTIAKFAKLAGYPVSTIRYYMKEGKIRPVAYSSSGYALFDKKQVADVKAVMDKK